MTHAPIHRRIALACCALFALLFSLDLRAEVLVVSGAANPTVTLSKNQVRDLYLGRVSALPDGQSVTLVDQPEASPLREEFYLKVANKSANQAKQFWAQLYFTGGGAPPRQMDVADLKKMLNSTPGAIGYIDRQSLDDSVRVLCVLP